MLSFGVGVVVGVKGMWRTRVSSKGVLGWLETMDSRIQ
jgi:hypothetical protein